MCTEVLMGGRPHQGYFQLLTIRIFIGFEIGVRPGNSIVYRNRKVCDGFASSYDGSPSYIEL